MSAKGQVDSNDEISLKEAILTSKDYFSEIIRSIPVILLITIPILAYQVYKAMNDDLLYEAPLSFMLDDDGGGGGAALSGLLGSIGLPIGGGGEDNLDKILELSKSRKISSSTVFTKAKVDGKDDILANHVISMLEENGQWNERGFFAPEQKYNIDGLRFSNDSLANFNLIENNGLKHLHEHLVGNSKKDIRALIATSYNEQTGIMSIVSNTHNPEISVALSNSLFEKLSSYYVEKSIEKQEITYKILKEKTDSIYNELQAKNSALANFKDSSQDMFARADNLTETRLRIDIQKLAAMYGEATKNLEVADFALNNKTPFISPIDVPVLPIMPYKASLLKAIIMGLILGGFIGAAFVVTRKMFRDALN